MCERPNDENKTKAMHGLTRSLVNNMVIGVTDGFSKNLEIVGVGYRAEAQGPGLGSSRLTTSPATLAPESFPTTPTG